MAQRMAAKNRAMQSEPNPPYYGNGNGGDSNDVPRLSVALRMRRLGHTYEQIAQQCGYAHASNARKAIKKAEAAVIRDDGRALVNRQADYIDVALQMVLKRIEGGDLWAVDRLTPLLKRQAELLGLDMPKATGDGGQMQTIVQAVPAAWAEAFAPAGAVVPAATEQPMQADTAVMPL